MGAVRYDTSYRTDTRLEIPDSSALDLAKSRPWLDASRRIRNCQSRIDQDQDCILARMTYTTPFVLVHPMIRLDIQCINKYTRGIRAIKQNRSGYPAYMHPSPSHRYTMKQNADKE